MVKKSVDAAKTDAVKTHELEKKDLDRQVKADKNVVDANADAAKKSIEEAAKTK